MLAQTLTLEDTRLLSCQRLQNMMALVLAVGPDGIAVLLSRIPSGFT